MFYHSLRIQTLTWAWLMTSRRLTPLLGVNLNPTSVCLRPNLKKTAQALKYINEVVVFFVCFGCLFFLIISQHQNYVQVFTDDSKVDEKVAAAAVSSVAPNSPFSCRLRDHCLQSRAASNFICSQTGIPVSGK